MTQKGFIFDLNRCTGCGACIVACSIENYHKQDLNLRQVYTFNETRHPDIPLFNLSMACNHCGVPACLKGCPAGAISKDPETGAVLVNSNRCFGCKYCTWACPYDAPRYNTAKGTIEKCDFCNERLKKGEAPACVCSCPTNALRFGDMEPDSVPRDLLGFTNAGLRPAIQFKPLRPQQHVPEATAPPSASVVEELFESSQHIPQPKISLKSEWALLTFTSIAFILVALLTASVLNAAPLNPFVFLGLGAAAMALSTIHLGKKTRAPFALLNFSKSWLSREIALFSAFLGISFLYVQFFPAVPLLGWICAVTGFLSLYAVDRIYQVAMQVTPLNFHSAQTLFNGLYLTGALIGNIFLFAVPGLIKLALYLYRKFHFIKQGRNPRPLISFLRIAAGLIFPAVIFALKPGLGKEPHIFGLYGILIACILFGELIDRTEYYNELDIITPRKQMLLDLEALLKKRKTTKYASGGEGGSF